MEKSFTNMLSLITFLAILCILFGNNHQGVNGPNSSTVNYQVEAVLNKIPNPYYISRPWPDHSAYGLELCVGRGFLIPYERGVFDCSNMASFLQWKLKKYGFDAKICRSSHFQGFQDQGDYNVGHAWVAVDISRQDLPTARYYLEATAQNYERESDGEFNFMIIKPGDKKWKYYNDYEEIYADIHDLGKTHPETFLQEYDWWTQLNYSREVNN